MFPNAYFPGGSAGPVVPSEDDVRYGVAVGSGEGNLVVPPATAVLDTENFDSNGATPGRWNAALANEVVDTAMFGVDAGTVGNYTTVEVGDVRDLVAFGAGSIEVGVLDLPAQSDVRKDVIYDNGTKTGTLDTEGGDIYGYNPFG